MVAAGVKEPKHRIWGWRGLLTGDGRAVRGMALAKPDAVTPADIADVPIGGLGILMAKNSVDEMRYERVGGSNVLTMVRRW